MPTPTGKSTRAERLAQPLAREVAEQVAADHGVCSRPVSLRRTNITTSATEVIDLPFGRVRSDGTPVGFSTYDDRRVARDTLHLSTLVDRFAQNLCRVAGFDVQYFASVEPQRRLAPRLHMPDAESSRVRSYAGWPLPTPGVVALG